MEINTDKHLFKLPLAITEKEQVALTSFVLDYGWDNSMVWHEQHLYIWKSFFFHHLRYEKIDVQTLTDFTQNQRSIDYHYRHRDDLEWQWADSPMTPLVQSLIQKLKPYIINLTRVQALLQRPTFSIPLHEDFMTGNIYDQRLHLPFESQHIRSNRQHQENGFFSLKIPLSQQYGDNGRPILQIGPDYFRYDVGNRAYAFDECRLKHGSQAVSHWRGVLSIDGLFDLQRLLAEGEDVPLYDILPQQIWQRSLVAERSDTSINFIDDPLQPRSDLRALLEAFQKRKLQHPSFLGAHSKISNDRRFRISNEFWRDEVSYREFLRQHELYVTRLRDIYNAEARVRNIQTHEEGHDVPLDGLKFDDRESLIYREMVYDRLQ